MVLGVNLDDLGDHRPGQAAAAAAGARFPLVDAGLTKDDVRAWSRHLGLRTWDKPAAACLASRLPYGTPVTLGTLRTVERQKSRCGRSGSRNCGCATTATWPGSSWTRPSSSVRWRRHDVVAAVRGAGYRYVTLDLEGFRSGNLNPVGAQPGAAAGTAPARRRRDRHHHRCG